MADLVKDLDDLKARAHWKQAADNGGGGLHVRSRLRGLGWTLWYHPPKDPAACEDCRRSRAVRCHHCSRPWTLFSYTEGRRSISDHGLWTRTEIGEALDRGVLEAWRAYVPSVTPDGRREG